MAAMDSDWPQDIYDFLKTTAWIVTKLTTVLSSFNLYLSYFKMKDLTCSGKKVDFCVQVAHIVPSSLQWGSCFFKQMEPKKGWNGTIIVTRYIIVIIATLADICQLSDTGPIGPLVYSKLILFSSWIYTGSNGFSSREGCSHFDLYVTEI